MARPFDDRLSSPYTGSSLSSQTSLAGDRAWMTTAEGTSYAPPKPSEDARQRWNKARPAMTQSLETSEGSRLAKIKSSPSNGALAAARKASSHGRLHKRGNSASASPSPISPTLDSLKRHGTGNQHFQTSANTQPISYSNANSNSNSNSMIKTKVMIKPFLRKLSSSSEQISIDLSRSAAENEGLGIYNSSEIGGGPANAELSYGLAEVGKRGYHQRTISGNSQISTISSSNNRYGIQYVHPTRQTPRPYTPTSAASCHNSLDSDISPIGHVGPSSEGTQFESPSSTSTSYAPLPPMRRLPQPAHIQISSSSYLTNSSQTNLPGTPSSLRRRADYVDNQDTMPGTARSSLESAFRRRNRTDTDPAVQAATVAALRQKFNEKEAAKDLKILQAEERAKERDAKRREKRQEESDRSEGQNRKRAKSNTTNEKLGMANQSEREHKIYHEEPFRSPDHPRRRRTETAGVAGKAVQSQWSLFWFKFKTMWLRLKRKVSGS